MDAKTYMEHTRNLLVCLLYPRGRSINPTNNQLEEVISFSECLTKFSGTVVVFGLLIEIILAIRFPEPIVFIQKWGPVLADIFVALGVIGEVFFSSKSGRLEKELRENIRRESDEKISEANKIAAQAIERAASLEKELSEARERTAKLEAFTAWRHILPEQRQRIISAIIPNASLIDVLIEFQNSDAEAYSYALEIEKLFVDCGIKKIRCFQNGYYSPIFGLHMASAPALNASAIAQAFLDEGISLTISNRNLSAHLPNTLVAPNLYFFVAPKIPPAMT
jgi:hypothetical protein